MNDSMGCGQGEPDGLSSVSSEVGEGKREEFQGFTVARVTPVLGGMRVESLLPPLSRGGHWKE